MPRLPLLVQVCRATALRFGGAILALGVLAGACSSATTDTLSPSAGNDLATLPNSDAIAPNATVERVIDGDTIIVDINGQKERVRLIGIDTPESVDPNRPVQCYGHEASAHTESLLPPGTPVSLVRDVEARDKYDRLLAYVIRSADQLFVNLDLVENGFAGSLTYPPNDHYAAMFEASAANAQDHGVGLWGVCGGPDVPLG